MIKYVLIILHFEFNCGAEALRHQIDLADEGGEGAPQAQIEGAPNGAPGRNQNSSFSPSLACKPPCCKYMYCILACWSYSHIGAEIVHFFLLCLFSSLILSFFCHFSFDSHSLQCKALFGMNKESLLMRRVRRHHNHFEPFHFPYSAAAGDV